jgi:hypothetical protein
LVLAIFTVVDPAVLTIASGTQHRWKTVRQSVPCLAIYFVIVMEHASARRRTFIKGAIACMVEVELADRLSASPASPFRPMLHITVVVSAFAGIILQSPIIIENYRGKSSVGCPPKDIQYSSAVDAQSQPTPRDLQKNMLSKKVFFMVLTPTLRYRNSICTGRVRFRGT